MDAAPPVVFPLARSRFFLLTTLSLWMLGLVTVGLAFATGHLHWSSKLLLLGALCVSGWGFVAFWQAVPDGHLVWDGRHWRLLAGGAIEGSVVCRLDVQSWMLLRFEPVKGRAVWLTPGCPAAPHRWLALRRAVLSGRELDERVDPLSLS